MVTTTESPPKPTKNPPQAGRLFACQEFEPETAAVRDCRLWAAHRLGELPMAGVALDTLLLMIDELAANAVRHGRTAFQVRLYLPCAGCLRVEVFDANAALPEPREADEDAEAGRGLLLIACMSERWGYVLAPPGKIVYADVLLAA